MTNVAVIGAGYVGLVSGVCLAELGHTVVCVDRDAGRVQRLNAGEAPIHEEGLGELIGRNLGRGFTATTDLSEAVRAADVTMIAVGTPSNDEGIDLAFVKAAAREVGEALSGGDRFHVVVVKSTVVPGTTETVVAPILEEASGRRVGEDLGVASNPEFLTEGTAVRDFMAPDRIVIGASDDRSAKVVASMYDVFPDVPRLVSNPRTAEMVKYASNALLATAISFSNELSSIGSALGGVDTVEVMRGVHASQYLTTRTEAGEAVANLSSFLAAGCGFGGSCLPKDVAALAAFGKSLGAETPLLDAVLDVNERQPAVVAELVEAALGGRRDATIGILGLAFKPDTSDVRESPAFPIIRLLSDGARLLAHDPVVGLDELPADVIGMIEIREDLRSMVDACDVLVIVTSWDEYLRLPEYLAGMEDPPLLVDGRRMLSPTDVPRYSGIGY
jgi:UDPglucose 6-dehydrogenase/GDP-mannose 6-dehydrogenase